MKRFQIKVLNCLGNSVRSRSVSLKLDMTYKVDVEMMFWKACMLIAFHLSSLKTVADTSLQESITNGPIGMHVEAHTWYV